MWDQVASEGARRAQDEEQPFLYYIENSDIEKSGLKRWDLFQDPPRKTQSGSMADMKFFDKSEKIMKLIAYVVTFIVVLGTAVISKGTLLFMTSQVFNKTKPYCNKDLGSNKQLVVNIPETERVVWIWMLFYAFCIPQFGTFLRSVRICLFKSWEYPKFGEFLQSVFTETLPAIGSAIMIYCVLPDLDVVKGAMLTNAICFIPALMAFVTRDPNCSTSGLSLILDVTSIAAQVTSFVVWPMVEGRPNLWLIPVSVILISFGWWENYVSAKTPIPFLKKFANQMKRITYTRYFIYAFVSLWKCLVFFITMLIIFQLREGNVGFLFDNYKKAMIGDYLIRIDEITPVISLDGYPNIAQLIQEGVGTDIKPDHMAPIWVFLINIGSSYLCYVFGKFACKVMIQGFSFAFPLCLATPVAVTGLIAMSSAFLQDDCVFSDAIPTYLFFDTPFVYMLKDFIGHQQSWIWLIWLLSQVWITIHIWTPTCVRQAPTEMLFVRPMYDPFFVDQDIALNRRRDDKDQISEKEVVNNDDDGMPIINETSNWNDVGDEDDDDDDDDDEDKDETITDDTTRIFACGTMWREEPEEMLEFLKSIIRLDEDQSARRLMREAVGDNDRDDYYSLESHVFFDDAFDGSHINKYVKNLIKNIDKAATNVHEREIRLRAPQMYETPYGGRLVWLLPGKTKLFVHLKDKSKIRPKKRWSQVMYMYYLLGHRLLDRKNLSPARKEKIAGNTYLLALDGDIDFQPKAVALLVDLMKKNKAVGAACGRIHPMGSGPMVWYQMFEYAVGHWLQKATEHMIGCVLCSPGCFSLFRGKALMDYNVMKKYTTVPTQARHYVQYDQGEDRWLCTLLLQRGYRVEYSAASDAYTHCPEGFDEFYKQRRRWMPSTTANILDLLMDYKHTIAVNDNISRLYIGYQLLLMGGTILGPGTIFLMLVGAFVAAFQLDQWSSFLWNIVPILIFIVVCKLFSKDEIQLFFAGVISGIYGLVMMAVLVGIMLQIKNDGLLAPSSLFFFCVAGEMIVTALLHPKELNCLVYGIVYYVTVPSMYMLLVIYTVFNMNNISWGTRDSGIEKEKANAEKQKIMENVKKEPNMQQKMMSFFNMNKDDGGSFEISIPGLFRCLFCTREKQPVEKYQLEEILRKLDDLSKGVSQEQQPLLNKDPDTEKLKEYEGPTPLEKNREDQNDAVSIDDNPTSWMEDELLRKGARCNIKNKQRDFWNQLLEKYLRPLELTEQEQKKGKEDLDKLRDRVVAAFFMLNSLFVLVIFLLTLKKEFLHIKWPFDVKTNFTYFPENNQIIMTKEYLQLEPIGLVFLFFFAILLVVQFVAMLFHRFKTLCQILSNTILDFSLTKPRVNEMTAEDIPKTNAIEFAKEMQRLNDQSTGKKRRDPVQARKTVVDLMENESRPQAKEMYLEDTFHRRKSEFINNPNSYKGKMKRETVAKLQRRMSRVDQQRKSMMTLQAPTLEQINRAYEEDI